MKPAGSSRLGVVVVPVIPVCERLKAGRLYKATLGYMGWGWGGRGGGKVQGHGIWPGIEMSRVYLQ